MRRLLVLLVMAASCKNGAGGGKPTPGPVEPGSSVSPIAWKLDGQRVELTCERALSAPTPAAAAAKPERPLPRLGAIKSCADQASVAAACDCLVHAFPSWGKDLGLSPQVECEPLSTASTDAQIVKVRSIAADDQTSRGVAFVVVAKHGGAWSPIGVIESAPDVDLSITPRASHTAKLDRVESHGNLYWIETHHESQEKDMGESERDGEAHGTVCVVDATPWCGQVLLGAWTYVFAPFQGSDGTCTITKAATYTASVTDHSVIVQLEHGTDDGGGTGKYTF